MTIASRLLVPRPNGPAVHAAPEPQHVPMSYEWAEQYTEIRRLYVHERRKLRYIIAHMEREHGFKATEQMYKKRFARWEFQKNRRRSEPAATTCITQETRRQTGVVKKPPADPLISLHISPSLNQHDALSLSLLANVRKWSTAFFEPTRSGERCLPVELPGPERARQTSFTLKIVSNLLERRQGTLAGKVARKAFLLAEDMLLFEGPALMWNLLEVMHHMLTLGHEQLFCMLLSHLAALVSEQLPVNYPLVFVLHDLQRLVGSMRRTYHHPYKSSSNSSRPSSPSSSSSQLPFGDRDGPSSFGSSLLPRIISPLLKEAWIVNAKIILDRFDPRLLQLYSHLHWESCSINLPSTVIGVTKKWSEHVGAQQELGVVTRADTARSTAQDLSAPVGDFLRQLSVPGGDISPLPSYEMLRNSSLAEFCEYWDPILKGGSVKHDVSATLRVMPALVKATLLRKPAADFELSSCESTDTSRSQANNVASVIRALMELHADCNAGRMEILPGAIERLRWIIALREHACGEVDPQVMQELWLLEDALAATGELEQAASVGQSVIARLESYTQDVVALYST